MAIKGLINAFVIEMVGTGLVILAVHIINRMHF